MHFLKHSENTIAKGSVEESEEIQASGFRRNTGFLILNCTEHDDKRVKKESQSVNYYDPPKKKNNHPAEPNL